ncbi:MAG: hypothetical protein SOV72_04425 [Candidatus Enteromonas sp.]|nr:hypothetical protein [Candidatus Enteromonas sp.]
MKTKAKLVLALSVLTAGTAVAGATGTFAWFTTNRSATLVYSNVTAVNNHGTLEVELEKLSDAKASAAVTAEDDKSKKTVTGSADSATTDISSKDGATLVKPIWTKDAGNGKPIEKTVAATYKTDYTVYLVGLKNSKPTALNVFLDAGTLIKATASEDAQVKKKNDALAKYTRVAVNDANTTVKPTETDGAYTVAAKNTIMFENNEGKTDSYLAPTATAGTAAVTALPSNTTEYTHIAGNFEAVNSGANANHSQFLIKLPGNEETTHWFTVTVWLEGTKDDGANFDACAGGSVDVNLQLVAYDA